MIPPLMQRTALQHCSLPLFWLFKHHCRSDTQSNYSQVSGASSNWEDTDYDDRGDRASNATEAHQRQPWQQQQQQQQQQPFQQPQDSARIPKKVTYAQQLVQSVFPQVMSSFFGAVVFPLHAFIREFQAPAAEWASEDSGAGVGGGEGGAAVVPRNRH